MEDCFLNCNHKIVIDALVHWIQAHQDRPRHCIIISALQMYAQHVVDRVSRIDDDDLDMKAD